MKLTSSILVILIIFVNSISSTSTSIIDETNNIELREPSIIQSDINIATPKINFGKISGGLGIKLSIKNEGNQGVYNVLLKVRIVGGLVIFPRIKNYEIPFIDVNESISLSIKIFGIGLGLFNNNIPNIEVKIFTSGEKCTQNNIYARIIGPLVNIIGINTNYGPFDGYTLFPVECSTKTYLINNSGEIVHVWDSKFIQGLAGYLLENGNLIRCDLPKLNPTFFGGGITGRVELFDWNSTLLWYFEYSTNQHCLHHDVEVLPNGNLLMIAWEYKTADEAIAAGRAPETVNDDIWPDHIIEVEPTNNASGNIVWEWHIWDHLIQDYDPSKANYGVVEDHPELIDINYVESILYGDWNHINSIDYHEEFDQILLSVRNFNEIWVIDHSTTIEEAGGHTGGNSGKGGDLLYRWGNPQTYRAGNDSDQKLFRQHDAKWIDQELPGEGNILVFNNGGFRPGDDYSSVDEFTPPVDINGNYSIYPGSAWGPQNLTWNYSAENPTDFYANYLSGAQRLPNGNTLICDGPHGFFFEVTPEKEIVWEYINLLPNPLLNEVNTIHRYAPDYPGLKNLFN